jgi:hypothetical protein
MKTSTAITRYLGLAALTLLLQACSITGSAIDGQVLEDGTNKPVPDAWVAARWTCASGHTHTVCYHVTVTTTDKEGRYHFPAWRKEGKNYCVDEPFVHFDVYKPGYAQTTGPTEVLRVGDAQTAPEDRREIRYRTGKREIRYMKPLEGTREERLIETLGAVQLCGAAAESEKNLVPLFRKVYSDAERLAVTKRDKEMLIGTLLKIDLIERPGEALDLQLERLKALRNER